MVNAVRPRRGFFRLRDQHVVALVFTACFAALIAVWDAVRIWRSPIRWTPAWIVGTVAGLALGAAAVTILLSVIFRKLAGRAASWLLITLFFAWLIALVTTHSPKGKPEPPVPGGYIVGALCYDMTVFGCLSAGLAVAMLWQARQQ